jgi:hypothetical protein
LNNWIEQITPYSQSRRWSLTCELADPAGDTFTQEMIQVNHEQDVEDEFAEQFAKCLVNLFMKVTADLSDEQKGQLAFWADRSRKP